MKQLLVLLMFLCSTSIVRAQDVIVKKDGSTIIARVLAYDDSWVVYKPWGDQNGQSRSIMRSEVSAINYQNGKKVNFATADNMYQPGNQNNGERQMNDNSLLRLDATTSNIQKKIKNLRIYGIIGGVVLAGAGVAALVLNEENESESDKLACYIGGGVGIAGGIACTSICLIKANNLQKYINSISLWQNNIRLNNGTTITPSIDLLKDLATNNKALGIGIEYKF